MLSSRNLTTLASRRNDISRKFFDTITVPSSCLHYLLPVPREHCITSRFRHHQKYPKIYTRPGAVVAVYKLLIRSSAAYGRYRKLKVVHFAVHFEDEKRPKVRATSPARKRSLNEDEVVDIHRLRRVVELDISVYVVPLLFHKVDVRTFARPTVNVLYR